MPEAAERPDIHLFRSTDDVAEDVIARFQEAVYANPDSFRRVIAHLAAPTMGLVSLEKVRGKADAQARTMVEHIFASGYDQRTEFDDTTEDALAANALHKRLIETALKQRNIDSHEGAMKVVRRENPNADATRDRVRWSRLSFFLLRVQEWEAARKTDDTRLPSAG